MRLLSIVCSLVLPIAGCAANPTIRGTSDSATSHADAGSSVPGPDAATPPLSAAGRRLVVHAMSTPGLPPPSGQSYVAVELSLINDAASPIAPIAPSRFEVQAQNGNRYSGVTPPSTWMPTRAPCPPDGSIPPDSRLRCSVLFAVPSDLHANRIWYAEPPGARTVLSQDPAAEAERLCREAGAATDECGDCLAGMSSGQCATETGWVEAVCAERSCSAFGRATAECASAVGSFHLCVEEICPSCEYIAGVH